MFKEHSVINVTILQTYFALEIIETTREQPINKNLFIAFKIVDKTLATHKKDWYMKLYLAYVNTNDDENPREKWGSKWQTGMEFYLKSKGSSIKPDVLHDVVVSFLSENKLKNILLNNSFIFNCIVRKPPGSNIALYGCLNH